MGLSGNARGRQCRRDTVAQTPRLPPSPGSEIRDPGYPGYVPSPPHRWPLRPALVALNPTNKAPPRFPPAPHRGRHAKSQSSPRYGAPSSPFVPSRQRCDCTAGSRTCPGRRRRLAAWTLGRDGGPPEEEEGQRPHVARLKGCARWAACRRVCTHSGRAVLRPPGRQRPVLRRWGPFQRGLWCSSPGRFRQNGASRASLAP